MGLHRGGAFVGWREGWPNPIAQRGHENDWLEYGNGRYAGITIPGTPWKKAFDRFYGDVLPSAFIDDMNPSGDNYIYVPYQFTGRPGVAADARLHIARAKIGNRSGHHEEGQLHFYKWYHGGWTQEGRAGLEDAVVPACGPSIGEGGAQIEYNDALHRYLMTFICSTWVCPPGKECYPSALSLYYTTATSLEKQDWTEPRMIEHSSYPEKPDGHGGQIIDGGYPSFVSPGCEPGHIGFSGTVFLLKGDSLGERRFVARTFTIRRARASGEDNEKAPGLENGCRPRPALPPAKHEKPK